MVYSQALYQSKIIAAMICSLHLSHKDCIYNTKTHKIKVEHIIIIMNIDKTYSGKFIKQREKYIPSDRSPNYGTQN